MRDADLPIAVIPDKRSIKLTERAQIERDVRRPDRRAPQSYAPTRWRTSCVSARTMRVLPPLALPLLLTSLPLTFLTSVARGAPTSPLAPSLSPSAPDSSPAPVAGEPEVWPEAAPSPPSSAPDASPSEGLAAVEIVGNLRTGSDVILAAAAIPPLPVSELALVQVKQRLLNLRLFETVEVTGRDLATSPRITIRVKERWTLFPIPFVSTSSRGVQGGVFLLETNLFGRNKTVVLGGSYASWGAAVFTLYRDPSVLGTRITLRANATYAVNDRERRVDDDVVASYRDRRLDLLLLPGAQLTERLNLSAGWFANRSRGEMHDDSGDGDALPPMALAGGWQHGPAAALEYRGSDFRTYYEDGLLVTAAYRQARQAMGAERDVLDLSGRVQYTRELVSGHASSVVVQADLIEGGSQALDVRLLGGRVGSRGFEKDSLWIDRSATLTLEHQVPFFVRGWGIWTALAFVDVGTASLTGPSGRQTDSFINPGAGLRLYLPRTSFPAVGLDVSYSPDSGETFTSVAVGVSM